MRVEFLGSGDAFGSGGRLNTCLRVSEGSDTLLLDAGATTLAALGAGGLGPTERNGIAAILFTHFHGDHFAGLPFVLLDAMFVSKRREPLLLAGPAGIEARARAVNETLFPGVTQAPRDFALHFLEVTPDAPADIAGFAVTALPMVHDARVGPCQGYRLARSGRVLAFTGDTGWTDALIPLADGADLLISECYMRDRKLPGHLDAATLRERRGELRAKRMIVTHLGPDVVGRAAEFGLEEARDGLAIEL